MAKISHFYSFNLILELQIFNVNCFYSGRFWLHRKHSQ